MIHNLSVISIKILLLIVARDFQLRSCRIDKKIPRRNYYYASYLQDDE